MACLRRVLGLLARAILLVWVEWRFCSWKSSDFACYWLLSSMFTIQSIKKWAASTFAYFSLASENSVSPSMRRQAGATKNKQPSQPRSQQYRAPTPKTQARCGLISSPAYKTLVHKPRGDSHVRNHDHNHNHNHHHHHHTKRDILFDPNHYNQPQQLRSFGTPHPGFSHPRIACLASTALFPPSKI